MVVGLEAWATQQRHLLYGAVKTVTNHPRNDPSNGGQKLMQKTDRWGFRKCRQVEGCQEEGAVG